MHISTRAARAFFACVGAIAVAASDTSGTVEVDLAFPRNETYAPTMLFPIVFAFQNTQLATFLNPTISFTAWDRSNWTDTVVTTHYEVNRTDLSSNDPYFIYRGFTKFNREGTWTIKWTLTWDSCTADALNSALNLQPIVSNGTDNGITFTTKNSAQEVDLVAATNGNNCSEDAGAAVAINVTETLKVPFRVGLHWSGGETCAVVASSTPKPDPCKIKVDSAAASSISASATAQVCRSGALISICPSEDDHKNDARLLVVGGVACLAAGLGTVFYVLM